MLGISGPLRSFRSLLLCLYLGVKTVKCVPSVSWAGLVSGYEKKMIQQNLPKTPVFRLRCYGYIYPIFIKGIVPSWICIVSRMVKIKTASISFWPASTVNSSLIIEKATIVDRCFRIRFWYCKAVEEMRQVFRSFLKDLLNLFIIFCQACKDQPGGKS